MYSGDGYKGGEPINRYHSEAESHRRLNFFEIPLDITNILTTFTPHFFIALQIREEVRYRNAEVCSSPKKAEASAAAAAGCEYCDRYQCGGDSAALEEREGGQEGETPRRIESATSEDIC